MHELHPELTQAMGLLLQRMNATLSAAGYVGTPVKMFLAGGMAVHYYCGTRYTADVDASFSRRLLLPFKEMTVTYQRLDGSEAMLYLDANYNDTFALLHPDHQENSQLWVELAHPGQLIELRVLSPLDLAVSKVSRFSPQDREDILELAKRHYFSSEQLLEHSSQALDYYVGEQSWIKSNLEWLKQEIARLSLS
jgi:hypothetical protein